VWEEKTPCVRGKKKPYEKGKVSWAPPTGEGGGIKGF